MAIATEKVSETFINVVANVPIPCNWPLYADAEVEVVYGLASLKAVLNVDYTVELDAPNYDTFSITPLPALLTAINDLIAADPDETNYTTIRRVVPYTTAVVPESVRQTAFVSREFERVWMGLQQVREYLRRCIVQPSRVSASDDEYVPVEIDPLEAGKVPVANDDGTRLINGPDAGDIAQAQSYAAAALASKDATQALRDEVEDFHTEILAYVPPQNNTAAAANPTVNDDANDGYTVGSKWYNVSANPKEVFLCADSTVGAAVWIPITFDTEDIQPLLDLKEDKYAVVDAKVASYQLVLTDASKTIEMNLAGANNLTVPANATVAFPVGAQVIIGQIGAGQTTIVAAGGVTINTAETLKLRKQYSYVTLLKVAADTWRVMGDLELA
jgi:hypothetical protein